MRALQADKGLFIDFQNDHEVYFVSYTSDLYLGGIQFHCYHRDYCIWGSS
jgi:hypothetical protein